MASANTEGELWGAKARVWAEQVEHVTRPLWEAMLQAAKVGPGTRFLDLGCGAAGSSVFAAIKGASITGLDASTNLLKIAKERLPEADFRHGEIEDLPCDDNSFDVVFAANSIQYVDDRDKAMAEIRRVMAQDGKFVIGMWCEPDRSQMYLLFKALTALAPPAAGPPTLTIRDNLVEMLESNGFDITQEGEVLCPFEFDSVDAFIEANSASGIMVGVARQLGEEVVRETMCNTVSPLADGQGKLRLENWFRYLLCA